MIGLLVAPQGTVRAAELPQIISVPVPPFLEDRGGEGVGPAAEIAAELARAAGIDPVIRLLPPARLFDEVAHGNRIVAMFVRTPEREPGFLWIGPMVEDGLAFATIRPSEPLDTLEAAHGAGPIAVFRGSLSETVLTHQGFDNLEATPSEPHNARMLDAHRMAAWFAPVGIIRHVWHMEKLDPADLQIGKTVVPLPFWIAGTKDLPPDMIARMTERYAALRNNGDFDKITAPTR